jgi:hypothetical protein
VDTNPTGRPEAFVGAAVGASACSFKDAFGGSEPEALGSPLIEDGRTCSIDRKKSKKATPSKIEPRTTLVPPSC